MSKQASGKEYEKRMAKILGAQHIQRPNYGVSAPDISNETIVGECKLRETLALEGWMEQVEIHAIEPHTIPVVVCKQKRLSDDKSIVCMRIPDFLKIMEKLAH